MRVLHVITSLESGGAEHMLLRTVEGLLRSGVDCRVLSLTGGGAVASELEKIGLRPKQLGMRSAGDLVRVLGGLTREIDVAGVDVIHSWMYHANVATFCARMLSKQKVPIVSAVHHSLDNETDASMTRRLARTVDAVFSRTSAAVIFASSRAMQQHCRKGYSSSKAMFLPNGFDTEKFAPDAGARVALRKSLGIAHGEFVVGCVARFDPAKDHQTFFAAVAEFVKQFSDVKFLFVGRGATKDNPAFDRQLKIHKIQAHCLCLGERPDIPALFGAMDVACLSSKTEGFPLTLGEAMCCALPCVATDVGDCRLLLGDAGLIVPPSAPTELAHAWQTLKSMDRMERLALGERARMRIAEQFSMQGYLSRLIGVYRAAVSRSRRIQ